ncbi:poly [ADP-ribose] polymerase [Diprion similis]|uniref:poly [ADP-ribose] polymerase n=1 Tax=Diprion similis TaxID=362088 RepID=UPI001EF7BE57|nr:poly [ADP-ribose] polymerase [Diprion similis]
MSVKHCELPYYVEYSKSGRAKCKACKSDITQGSLRIAAMVQSPFHDGKIPHWYHSNCFFLKQRPKTTGDIANFDGIRWEDQEVVAKELENVSNTAPTRGKKRSDAPLSGALKDFKVEYAKSNRAMCRGCEETIIKNEVRISKKDYESENARAYGGQDRWYHVQCFSKLRKELQFFETGKKLPGFEGLNKEDQETLKKSLTKIKEDAPPTKKLKSEPSDPEEEEELKLQNQIIFSLRDKLSALPKRALISLLETNEQKLPEGISNMLDAISDAMTFGVLNPCPKCQGQLVYKSGLGYMCTGDITEWTKCEYVTQDPKRSKFVVPAVLKEEHPFLKAYKSKVKRKLIRITAPTTSSSVKKEDEVDSGPKIQGKPKPLKNMEFLLVGKTQRDKEELKKEILLLGGKLVTKIHKNLAACISNPTEVEKMNKRMQEIKEADIQVVSEDFIDEAKEFDKPAIMLINKKNICTWGGDPSLRIATVVEKSKSRGKSQFEKSVSGKIKMRVKGGGAVDPDSGLEDKAHIYQSGQDKYTVTLGITDIQSKKNSYYKLQVLKDDNLKKYWLFRSWGRIGTSIGGTKLENLGLQECIEQFEFLYEEKSGNKWSRRDNFVKVPSKMYPIDVDYGEDDETKNKFMESEIKSNLKRPLQDLIKLIFDVDTMRKVMLEFEIDLAKMPLGKLSKKQIDKAYKVLSELQEFIRTGGVDRCKFVDASNRFYTLIPHDFGVSDPIILENEEQIKSKSEMLDSLLELEIAYNLLNAKTDESKNPIDAHYEQLNTEIDILDVETNEFKLIERYVKNTHASTHSHYELEIDQVFVVKRKGEDKRYKPFKKLPNRKLLWHGSRTTNYAGILSQGLRIAPPEAPVSGYMFGKGIYFADMVSKSANYCCTNRQNPTGLLLLCEVALGNTYERHAADYIEKLPKGKHSTLGLGQTRPDPDDVHVTSDGVHVPYGKPVPAKLSKSTCLLYNEYIVYDVAQVQVQYLVRTHFQYKL